MSDEILKRLEFINKNLVANENQSYFLGKEATTFSSRDYFIYTLINYTQFSSKYLSTPAASAETILGQVYFTTDGTAWSLATTLSGDPTAEVTLDFNFTNALKPAVAAAAGAAAVTAGGLNKPSDFSLKTTSSTATSFTNLLDLLDTIRVTYNALEDAKFKLLKAEDSNMVVKKYNATFSNGVITYTTLTGSANITPIVLKLIPNIANLDHSSSNLLAIRRVLLGYECMIHAYLALHIFKATNGTSETKVQRLVNGIINKMIALNDKTYDSNSGISDIQTNLNKRIQSYNNNRQRIDEVDKNISDIKLNITVENNHVLSKSALLQKNTYFYYAFLSLFVILLVVLLYAQQQATNPSGQTKIMVGSVFVISIVSMFVMYIVNRSYLRESFALPNSGVITAVGTGNADNLINLYEPTLLATFDQYLANTIYVALLLGTYRRYGDISHAMNKEFNYYDSLTTQLKQSKEKLNSTQVQDYRTAKVLQYRVYLFLQILMIVSLVVLINLYVGTNNYLLAFMVFLVLFMVYMYILNTQNLVHTDATKLYWDQPNTAMLY